MCLGLLTAGIVVALATHGDRFLTAATPSIAVIAGLLMPRLRALQITLLAMSACLGVCAIAVDGTDARVLEASLGLAALLGLLSTAHRPRFARLADAAASAIARRLQASALAARLVGEGGVASRSDPAVADGALPATLDPPEVQQAAAVPGLERLSGRQKEVVALVLQGLTAREVGVRLFISERTVETHLANVYERLEVHSRRQLIQMQQRPVLHVVGETHRPTDLQGS